MSTFISSLYQEDGTVVVTLDDGEVMTATKDHPQYRNLKDAFKNGDADTFVTLYNRRYSEDTVNEQLTSAAALTGNHVEVIDGQVFVDGQAWHHAISEAVRRLYREGFSYQPLVNFIVNVLENPSYTSRKQLWDFLEQLGLTITEDGYFLGYKGVLQNYYDKYTGHTHVNEPGAIITMPRSEVEDNPAVACGPGLHVGALTYARNWAGGDGRMVIVKVNPKDVVSVPSDHSHQKMRCCEYTVVADYKGELAKSCYSGAVDNDEYDDDTCCEEDDDWKYLDSADDVLNGRAYQFEYYKAMEGWKTRYAIVEDSDDDHVYCILLEPEEDEGGNRNFLKDNMRDIEEYDI